MTVAISKVSVVREVGRNKRIIGGSVETSSSYGGGGGGGSSTSPFLPSLDQTITGAWTFNDVLTIKEGADKGLRFPPDAFGGTGDTATMTLESTTGEDLKWKFSLTNEVNDKFYFSAPSNNGMLFNDNIIYHAGNSNLSSIDWTANDLNVYGDLIIRGEVINPTGEIILVDDAWVMLNNGNSEVDSGLRIDIDGAGTAFSSLYRKASDDAWYIDTAKIALSNGTIQTNLNSDLLDGYHAADFPRKIENATILGSWTYLGGVIFSGSDFGDRTLIAADGSISTYGGGVLQNRIASSGDNYLNRTDGKLRVGSSTAPTEALDVTGNGKFSGNINALGNNNRFGALSNGGGYATLAKLQSQGNGGTGQGYAGIEFNTGAFSHYGAVALYTSSGDITSTRYNGIVIDHSGRVAINKSTGDLTLNSFPTEALDIVGNIILTGNLRRAAHNTGHLEGSYNNIGANDTYSNPIYTIGSSYNPELTTLASMYGLGYANANTATFLSWVGGNKSWGQYIAAGGTANIFLDSAYGKIHTTGGIQGAGAFLSGFAGSNYFLNPNDGGDSHLTIDRLTVRGRMDVYELVINQIRATNGSLWVSDAVKVVLTQLVDTDTRYRLYLNIDTVNTLVVNDIVKAQQFDGRNVRVFVGQVQRIDSIVTPVYATTVPVVTPLSGTPWDGMDLVRIGNTTDTNRQGALYLTSSDSGSPYMDIIDGVTSSSLSGKSRLRVGKLSGIAGETGYGIWGSSDGINESFVISSGLSAPESYARIAGWNFDNASIYKDFKGSGIQVFMGQDPILGTNTSVRGFGITKDAGNRMLMAQVGTGADFEISSLVGGKYHFQLLSTGINQIAGWTFGETTFSKLVNGVTVWMGNDPTNANSTGFGSYVDTLNYIRMISANGHSYLQGHYNSNTIFDLRTDTTPSTIAGWNFDNDTIWLGNKYGTVGGGIQIGGTGGRKWFMAKKDDSNFSQMYYNDDDDWGVRGRFVGNYIFQLGSTNQIAGWNFDSNALWSGTKSVSGVTLSASEKSLGAYKTATDYIKMFYTGTLDWGIDGKVGGVSIFQLGAINKIAGWNFELNRFYNNNIELKTGDNDSSLDFKYNNVSSAVTGIRWFSDNAGTVEVASIRYDGTVGRADGINIKSEYIRFEGKNYGSSGNSSLAQMDGMGLRISGSSAGTLNSGGRIMSYSASGHDMQDSAIAAYSILHNSAVAISSNSILPTSATLLSRAQYFWDGAFSSEGDFNGLTIKITNVSSTSKTITAESGATIRDYDIINNYAKEWPIVTIRGYETLDFIFYLNRWYLSNRQIIIP